MICETYFDKLRDLCEVEPALGVDLAAALQNGVIPNSGDNPIYNDIDSSESVSGRVCDVFEAVDLQQSFLDAASRSKGSKKASPSAPAAQPSTSTGATD